MIINKMQYILDFFYNYENLIFFYSKIYMISQFSSQKIKLYIITIENGKIIIHLSSILKLKKLSLFCSS